MRTNRLLVCGLSLGVLAGCGTTPVKEDGGTDGGTDAGLPPSPLAVVSTEPGDGSTNVSLDQIVRVVFNHAVPDALELGGVTVRVAAGALTGQVLVDGGVVKFVPARFAAQTTYTVRFPAGFGPATNPLAAEHRFSFTTGTVNRDGTSGFTNDTLANAETMDGVTVRWMGALASEVNAVVTGSVVLRDGDRFVNRLVWMRPDESFAVYDKRHLLRMANEHERYAGGDARLEVELNGWRVCPMVCYDLRFPVFMRNTMRAELGRMDYHLLLFVANWPAPRRGPWRTLLRARAIENLCYSVCVNRVGSDGNGLNYAGDSAAIDFLGEALVDLDERAQVVTTTLSAAALNTHRERFPAWRDADAFTLQG